MTADVFVQNDIFPTPLLTNLYGTVDAHNASLKKAILAQEKVCKGMTRSNARLTWHSKYDMKDWCGTAYADMQKMFMEQFTLMAKIHAAKEGSDLQIRITMWAMVQREGDYATPHTHPNCNFSAVYYVDPGKFPGKYKESGCLEVFDPRGSIGQMTVPGMRFVPRYIYPPKAGLMITFPAWLTHMVHPSSGGGARIAIAANGLIIKYKPKKEASNA